MSDQLRRETVKQTAKLKNQKDRVDKSRANTQAEKRRNKETIKCTLNKLQPKVLVSSLIKRQSSARTLITILMTRIRNQIGFLYI